MTKSMWRRIAIPAAMVLLVGLVQVVDAEAFESKRYQPAALPKTPSVPGKNATASSPAAGKVPIVTGRNQTKWPTANAVKAEINHPGDLGGSDHCTPAGATEALC